MTGADICQAALVIINSGKYVYWYGGKGQKCSSSLLASLSSLYPSIYTYSYKAKCRRDIIAGKYCIDCSGLVSKVYGWSALGTWGIKNRNGVSTWKKTPQNGMIVWRSGHCGIYYNGKILEARGQKAGLTSNRKYVKKDWTCALYDINVDYSTAIDLNKIAADIIAGKYGNGIERTEKLKAAGLTAKQIKDAQTIVNEKLAGE